MLRLALSYDWTLGLSPPSGYLAIQIRGPFYVGRTKQIAPYVTFIVTVICINTIQGNYLSKCKLVEFDQSTLLTDYGLTAVIELGPTNIT